MKKRIILSLLLLTITVAAFCQVTNDQAADILTKLGLSKALALTILAIVGVLIGKIVPNRYADIFHYIRLMFDWLDEHTNRLSVKQKTAKTKLSGKAFKMIILAVLLSGIGLTASAQGPWHGFFKPVPQTILMKSDGTTTSQFLFRPTAAISAAQFYIEDKKLVTSTLSGAGVGVSYNHFKAANEQVYNDYGFNALALFGTTAAGNLKVSPVLTVSYLNFSAGGGYDIAEKRAFIITSITLSFN